MDSEITKIYGNRVRIRASGLCREGDRLLLMNHKRLTGSDFWAPPGGGVEFGESVSDTLKREFLEEANLSVEVGPFAFGCEFIKAPLHSVELFFEVTVIGGNLKPGYDPELQIIGDASFLLPTEILAKPADQIHGIFKYYNADEQLRNLHGFYRI